MECYDAGQVLGLHGAPDLRRECRLDTQVSMSYGPWCLNDLARSPVCQALLDQSFSDLFSVGEISRKFHAGNCLIRAPIPRSNFKSRNYTERRLHPSEILAPAVLLVTYLLCCHVSGEPDRLDGRFIQGNLVTPEGHHYGFAWRENKLCVAIIPYDSYGADDAPWLAGVVFM